MEARFAQQELVFAQKKLVLQQSDLGGADLAFEYLAALDQPPMGKYLLDWEGTLSLSTWLVSFAIFITMIPRELFFLLKIF